MTSILEAFADRFWTQESTKKNCMTSHNSIYSLAFSIVTLDQNLREETDPQHQKDLETFIVENIGLNDGENFDA
jgi:hypothetical protein